jgi:hypothetical protein
MCSMSPASAPIRRRARAYAAIDVNASRVKDPSSPFLNEPGGMMVKVPTWSVTTPVRRLIPLVAGLLKVKWDGEASGDRKTKSQSIPSPERSDPGKGSRRAGEGLGLTAWREAHL